MAFYPPTPATDVGAGQAAPANAFFEVYELADTSFTAPCQLFTAALTNGSPLVTSEQGVVPAVYVVSPNLSHNFKSGDWVWRRDSFDAAERRAEAARAAAVAAAVSAAASAKAAQDARDAAAAGGGGGGAGLTPDPNNPGLFILAPGGSSGLRPDPNNPGLYLMGA